MFDFPFLITGLFVGIFFVQALWRQQFNWFWFAVATWLAVGWFSGRILPNILGISAAWHLFVAHFYVFAGSIFFFLNSTFRLPERPATWQAPQAGGYLTLLAVSGASLHIAYAILLALTWWTYPQGYAAMLPARLLTMYTLDPIFWLGMQFLLMCLFFLHNQIRGVAKSAFSLPQIQAGVLLALVWQGLYAVDAYRWLPKLLRWLWFRMTM